MALFASPVFLPRNLSSSSSCTVWPILWRDIVLILWIHHVLSNLANGGWGLNSQHTDVAAIYASPFENAKKQVVPLFVFPILYKLHSIAKQIQVGR